MSKPEIDRRVSVSPAPQRKGRRTDATSMVREALGIQARLGFVCAVELMWYNGVPSGVISRVLVDGECRADDRA